MYKAAPRGKRNPHGGFENGKESVEEGQETGRREDPQGHHRLTVSDPTVFAGRSSPERPFFFRSGDSPGRQCPRIPFLPPIPLSLPAASVACGCRSWGTAFREGDSKSGSADFSPWGSFSPGGGNPLPCKCFTLSAGPWISLPRFGFRCAFYQAALMGDPNTQGGIQMAKKELKKGKKLNSAKTLVTVPTMRGIF